MKNEKLVQVDSLVFVIGMTYYWKKFHEWKNADAA